MNADDLTLTFQALADPTRRAILQRLIQGEASVGELAEPFAMSLPAISKHLSVLERAELIERQRDARFRRCRLKGRKLRMAADWIEQYRQFWEVSFDRLTSYLEQEEKNADPKPKSKSKRAKRTLPTRG